MINFIDSDCTPQQTPKTLSLSFESSELEKAGIRVTRAEFSRIMGCSKQAVTEWVKSGRVTLGADGRLDPRQAVAQLLRTGDPARLRAKVLEPLVRELERQGWKISALAAAAEDAEFYEASARDLSRLFDQFKEHLAGEWDALIRLPPGAGLAAILGWLDAGLEKGVDEDLGILDFAERSAADEKGVGGDDDCLESLAPDVIE